MIEAGRQYMVMGLLDRDSLAAAIGNSIKALGGKVVYTMQNSVFKRRFLDKDVDSNLPDPLDGADHVFCDVTKPEQVAEAMSGLTDLAGLVYSVAYANPKTCLGEEFHTDQIEDILKSYQISCVALADVTRQAVEKMKGGGSVVAMTFDTKHIFPFYNWMGVHKSALEALVRGLARRHGRDNVRINAVSAGPMATTAATNIPGFTELMSHWGQFSPLPWDVHADKVDVADTVTYLVGNRAKKITGQVIHVDGGASICGAPMTGAEIHTPKA
jgi:enoyl ACP reductase